MLNAISKVTGIEVKTIEYFKSNVAYATVAEKMGWASKRKTTRLEDIAYSLLGIFDVTMPIAYGEGRMAFRRLLEAIAQRYEDITFFAWCGSCSPYSSALPSSPASYIKPVIDKSGGDTTFTVHKHGVQVKLLVIRVHFIPSGNRYALRPIDTGLARQMSIIGEFPEPLYGLDKDYTIGVVNYAWRNRTGFNRDSYGLLRARQRYFCVAMQSPWSVDCIGLVSWKMETGGSLPMIECRIDYETRIQTICLRHYTPFI
ncbi:hypothetical protein J3R83DRAFT_5947 [Lanmaoa asiatica]|nr:hypothetical protein J3R83DRAFT_5947 [Lanmaoa asiatica]